MADRYADSGVNVDEADKGISRLVELIRSTWPVAGFGAVQLPIGYFANVIDFGVFGVAMCTDGVGSKTVLCDMLNKYDTIGIDCVAMNVNDLICVGAKPVSMTDYIGVGKADSETIAQIGVGLVEGARQAGISISGGEVSQLKDIIDGFDLVGNAIGIVPFDAINTGSEVAPGDVVIGVASSGLHSNGYTLARKVLLDEANLELDEDMQWLAELYETGQDIPKCPLGEELLRPTHIYVNEVLDILDAVPVKALVNITGDGLLNLLRINNDVSFALKPPNPPAIFRIIQRAGDEDIDDATMYEVFNMGVGFCIVVEPQHAKRVQTILSENGRQSWDIGYAVPSRVRKAIYMPAEGLIGVGKKFEQVTQVDVPR